MNTIFPPQYLQLHQNPRKSKRLSGGSKSSTPCLPKEIQTFQCGWHCGNRGFQLSRSPPRPSSLGKEGSHGTTAPLNQRAYTPWYVSFASHHKDSVPGFWKLTNMQTFPSAASESSTYSRKAQSQPTKTRYNCDCSLHVEILCHA